MRIAHLLAHAGLNGVATSTHTLIQAQLRAGHEIMLVHQSPSWIEQQSFDRPIVTLKSDMKTGIAELRRVGYAIQDWKDDVLHTHGSRANKFGMVYRLVAGAPTVMTAHARLFQIPWRFAHKVIAPSQQTADYYLRRFLVTRSTVRVVPHMFEIGGAALVNEVSRRLAREAMGIRPDAFVVGSVGEICDRKNQIDMLLILKRLVQHGVDAELALIGRMITLTEADRWAELIADPVIAGRVHMVGQRNDAQALIHGLDAYLCTSRIEEGPIATLEAMACGVPVLTVDVGYSSKLLRDGENGRIFPIGATDAIADACVPFAQDPALGVSVGAKGRDAIAELLTADRIIPQIDAVYREAITASTRRPRQG